MHRSMAFWIIFALADIGCVLFKKTGIYLVAITFIIMFFVGFAFRHRSNRRLSNGSCKGLSAMFITACAAYCAVTLVLCPLLDVIPGSRQEMLAPVFHMTAAYQVEHPDEVTEEEKNVIGKVLDYERLDDMYEYANHDQEKGCYRQDATWADIFDYFGVWATQGLHHPDTYLSAAWEVISGYVSRLVPIDYLDNAMLGNASGSIATVTEDHAGFPQTYDVSDRIALDSPDWALQAQGVLRAGIDALEASPLIILLSSATYAFWVPVLSLICVAVRRRGLLLAYVPVVIAVLLVFVSPIVTFRYVLPLAAATPLLVGMVFAQRGKHVFDGGVVSLLGRQGRSTRLTPDGQKIRVGSDF